MYVSTSLCSMCSQKFRAQEAKQLKLLVALTKMTIGLKNLYNIAGSNRIKVRLLFL